MKGHELSCPTVLPHQSSTSSWIKIMGDCTEGITEQSDAMNTMKTEITSPKSEITLPITGITSPKITPKIEINLPEEVNGANEDQPLDSSTNMAENFQNMQLNNSTSSWQTTTDTSINTSPSKSVLENCDGLDSASLDSLSPRPLVRRRGGRRDGRSRDTSESSCCSHCSGSSAESSDDSYTHCSGSSAESSDDFHSALTTCSCSSCSECGGCMCHHSHQSSVESSITSFESTDDLTNVPRGKRGSPISKKEAKKINEKCSQS